MALWYDKRPGETETERYQRVCCDVRAHRIVLDVLAPFMDAELAWLRASLADDGAPDWLVEGVIENWHTSHVEIAS